MFELYKRRSLGLRCCIVGRGGCIRKKESFGRRRRGLWERCRWCRYSRTGGLRIEREGGGVGYGGRREKQPPTERRKGRLTPVQLFILVKDLPPQSFGHESR